MILDVQDLKVGYNKNGDIVHVLKQVDFSLEKGETLGIVGESGCGKSMTSLAIMGLLKNKGLLATDGKIVWEGKDLLTSTNTEWKSIRGKEISMIFQEPMTALNPLLTIGTQIMEQLAAHDRLSKKERIEKAIEMLNLVGIPSPELRMKSYPHELSGGMRQRVMIAMAISCQPRLLIADEPTTALDVTIQAQILDLLADLTKKLDMAMILITHDLGVVANNCQKVIVMYAGRVMEEASKDQLFEKAYHPYTQGLLQSVTSIEEKIDELYSIPGRVPMADEEIQGCIFQDRCPFAGQKCQMQQPPLTEIEGNRKVSCWRYKEIAEGVAS
ncbi:MULTISPECIES: ABC transporter ATP-binding protein [Bacillaceae]|jgi:oligopeptide/dipeptide ABC transporter ATP-binding protein|uniref:ABC transporter ATP-binding protein n=2 Tax=Bacillaceae TaxID=186817 RepID=A0ABV1F4S7_9BACI|nr:MULTISPECIES: ABC transporter ATP-binding protein [Bacillaceae]